MNVLSLFDGISCGQLALRRAGIRYDNYFASEIDKRAIAVTQYNFPNTIQLGDICNINAKDLPPIDLIIGGSPCTNISTIGSKQGLSTTDKKNIHTFEQYIDLKQKGYKFAGQSYLFWEYIRLLRELQPKYFLLENVIMVHKWLDVFTKAIGVEPILIDSALVSAQHRKRYYWTNINNGNIKIQPVKNFLFKDILECGYVTDDKSNCITASYGTEYDVMFIWRHRNHHVYYMPPNNPICTAEDNKEHPTVNVSWIAQPHKSGIQVRRLTVLEMERLQTLPDNYTKFGTFNGQVKRITDIRRIHMIGNGWTVEVIKYIFKFIEDNTEFFIR